MICIKLNRYISVLETIEYLFGAGFANGWCWWVQLRVGMYRLYRICKTENELHAHLCFELRKVCVTCEPYCTIIWTCLIRSTFKLNGFIECVETCLYNKVKILVRFFARLLETKTI